MVNLALIFVFMRLCLFLIFDFVVDMIRYFDIQDIGIAEDEVAKQSHSQVVYTRTTWIT